MANEQHKWTSGFEELVENSYQIRQEIEVNHGVVPTFIPYKPTDWSKTTPAEVREFWDGWKEENGYCEKCNMLKSASGACNCD